MPSFQSLPAEVLLLVAQFLGARYIRAHTDRVLFCKAWYSVTQSVAWEIIDLRIANFEGFLKALKSIHYLVRHRIKELSIAGSYDDNITSPTDLGETDAEETWRVAKLRNLLQVRSKTLCTSLTSFSNNILPDLHRLQSFSIKITSRSSIYTEVDNAWTATIRGLITSLPNTITSLTVDKLGPVSRFSTGVRSPHTVCNVVLLSNCLPSLKHLRLRVHCICPSLFAIKTCNTQNNLQSLVTALDFYSPQLNMVHHALRYAGTKALEASCFPGLKTARVLKYDVQALAMFSLDLVSGRKIEVPEDIEWDDVVWDESRLRYDMVLRTGGGNPVLGSRSQSESQ